jgi:hypothetical protein
MTTALAVTVNSLADLRNIAQMLAASNYFDAKGNSEQAIAQIATKILAGQELGYGPFASVQGIHVIQGKPAMSANLMAAAVKASARYDYRVRQMDESAVSIEFFERIGGKLESLGVSTFTEADAKKAGTQNMQKYGRNMMFSRAMSNGVKWYCPDVFSGNAMYTPEELGASVNGDGEVIETTYTVAQPAPEPAAPAPEHNGNGASPSPAVTAQKGFHAVGVKVFGKEWDAARPWLLKRYTGKNTPDNVREHTSDMSVKELETLRSLMDKSADYLRGEWAKVQEPPIDQPLTVDMEAVEAMAA